MSLDVSDAITLAKDLLQTSDDFRPHDPEMAAEFSNRAYQICDDLGIDPKLIGPGRPPLDEPKLDLIDEMVETPRSKPPTGPTQAELADEEARQTSQQLRALLQQQARVLENVRDTKATSEPQSKRRGFRLFGRSNDQPFGALQSA